MIAVMYHYVRKFNKEFPYLKFLDIKNFKKQLDFFKEEYGFVSKNEFDNFIKEKKVPYKKIILTFDDGFVDHYTNVFKELKKRDLWGIFYIPTGPYINGYMLYVHRIHLLCGKILGTDLLNKIMKIINKKMIPDIKIKEFRDNTYVGHNDNDNTIKVKRILNYFIDYEYREHVVNQLCNFFKISCDVNNFYLTKKQIKEMSESGMIFGSHSITHPVLSKLNYNAQKKEIINSSNYIEDIISKVTYKTFCYPYGGTHSFNKDSIKILEKYKYDFSFSVENRIINKEDLLYSKQSLPRFDCNVFPYGSVSIGNL